MLLERIEPSWSRVTHTVSSCPVSSYNLSLLGAALEWAAVCCCWPQRWKGSFGAGRCHRTGTHGEENVWRVKVSCARSGRVVYLRQFSPVHLVVFLPRVLRVGVTLGCPGLLVDGLRVGGCGATAEGGNCRRCDGELADLSPGRSREHPAAAVHCCLLHTETRCGTLAVARATNRAGGCSNGVLSALHLPRAHDRLLFLESSSSGSDDDDDSVLQRTYTLTRARRIATESTDDHRQSPFNILVRAGTGSGASLRPIDSARANSSREKRAKRRPREAAGVPVCVWISQRSLLRVFMKSSGKQCLHHD